MYKIKIFYTTGDSFGSEDTTAYLDLTWEDLEVAKQALARIKEHDDYYRDLNNTYKRNPKDPAKPKWFTDQTSEYSIPLPLDNGGVGHMGTFWMGYFENLRGAKIELSLGNDSKFGDTTEG
jgi:hypothetical protein